MKSSESGPDPETDMHPVFSTAQVGLCPILESGVGGRAGPLGWRLCALGTFLATGIAAVSIGSIVD